MADRATIKLDGDNAPLKEALNESKAMFSEWGVAIKVKIVDMAVQMAAAIKQQLVQGFKDSVAAALEAEAVMGQLDARLKSLGPSAARSRDEIEELTDLLVGKSWFDDETITRAQTSLLQFSNVHHDTFERAQQDAADWAVATGQDLVAATEKLGRALNDPLTAMRLMKEAGINLTDVQEELLKSFVEAGDMASAQNIILTELEARFRGTAQAMVDSNEGGIKQYQKAIGDLQEDIGNVFMPLIASMSPALSKVAETIRAEIVPAFRSWIEGMQGLKQQDAIPAWADNASIMMEDGLIKYKQMWLEVKELDVRMREAIGLGGPEREALEKEKRQLEMRRFNNSANAEQIVGEQDKVAKEKAAKEAAAATKEAERVAAEDLKRAEAAQQVEDKRLEMSRNRGANALRDRARASQTPAIVLAEAPPNWWDVLGGAIVENARGREFRDEGFQASIEDALGLNARITAAAASIPPEVVRLDRLIEQGREAINNAQQNAAAIARPLAELARKTFGLG